MPDFEDEDHKILAPADIVPFRRSRAEEAEQRQPQPLPWIDISAWDDAAIPEQDWTVRNRFPRRQCVLFSGEGAAGKSTIQLQLCAATSLAKDWLGSMPEPGPSFFIDAEDDADVMHRRLAAMIKHYGVSFRDLIGGGFRMMSLAGQDAVLATISRGGKIAATPLYDQLLQAAGDLKPVMIGMASSANFFAGNELDRAQVQQFIGMMTKLAIVANGTTVLISHPSLTGISSDSGLSGNTQWHNAVRARCYIRGVKQDQDNSETTDSNLREIFWKKSNYGPVSESIVLEWRDGMFLPKPGMSSAIEHAAAEAKADAAFLTLLRRYSNEGRTVGHKRGPSYAPAIFAGSPEAAADHITSKMFEAAMERLFQAKAIFTQQYGRPSRPYYQIVISSPPAKGGPNDRQSTLL